MAILSFGGKLKNANEKHYDMVRYDYIDKLGYYCTESSEHNAEYNYLYIKEKDFYNFK